MTTTLITNIFSLVAIAVVVVLVSALVTKMSKTPSAEDGSMNKARTAKDDGGVAKAKRALARYAQIHGFELIENPKLSVNGKVGSPDAVMVTYSGVVGVRFLGYNGELYANPGEKTWRWVTQTTSKDVPDPVALCSADMRAIREVLMQDKALKNVPVECLPVFTDPELELAVPKSIKTWTAQSFAAALKEEKYLGDLGYDKDKIAELIRKTSK